jgi:hypothetical protein
MRRKHLHHRGHLGGAGADRSDFERSQPTHDGRVEVDELDLDHLDRLLLGRGQRARADRHVRQQRALVERLQLEQRRQRAHGPDVGWGDAFRWRDGSLERHDHELEFRPEQRRRRPRLGVLPAEPGRLLTGVVARRARRATASP